MKTTYTKIFLGVLLLAACEENDDGADEGAMAEETGEAEESGGSSSSSSGGQFDELFECQDAEPAVVQPLAGPGYDPEMGLIDPQDNYIVSSTMIMVKPDQMGYFFELAGAVTEQALATDGIVALSLAQDPNCGWLRTMTVWRDETAMYSFVVTDAHAEAMEHTFEVGITGKVTSWQMAASEMPPTWATAQAKLAEVEPLESY